MEVELALVGKRYSATLTQDGRVLEQFRFDPLSVGSQKTTARKCRIDVPTLLNEVARVKEGEPVRLVPPEAVVTQVDFVVRDMDKSEGEDVSLPAEEFLSSRLQSVPVDQVIVWPEKDSLCCLDVDYHESTPPDRALLQATVLSRIAPKPYAWHFSRGGGLHLFYTAADGLSAEELAAVAALRFRLIDPTAGVELKRVVRGPGSESVHFLGEQDTSGTLLDWLREPQGDTVEVDEYLEEHGLQIGRRYNHTQCPVAPSPDEGKHREPVVIGEHGVTCYVCEGASRTWGSRRAGWFPWTAILGHPSAGVVGSMVRGLCHWGHAKWVLGERYGLKGELAQLAYRAALKAYHEGRDTEELVPLVFDRDTDRLARVGVEWMDIEDVVPYSKGIAATVGKIPACNVVGDKGPKVVPARVANMMEPVDWRDRGYPPVNLIFGIKMAPSLAPYADATVAVASPELKRRGGDRVLPRYVPFSKRVNVAKARETVERLVPGVNWNLIDLVLCGIGSTQETNLGAPPRIFVSGPSMAAKSSHFHIACAIAGVNVAEPQVQGSDERLRQAIMQGIKQGPVVVINEIFKDSVRAHKKTTPTQALEPILTFEKNSMTHTLYKGPEKFGKQFVLGLTEIVLPPDIRAETQLARRIRYVPLTRSHPEWRGLMAGAKLRDFADLRLAGPDMVDACNAILSDAIDRFFSTPMSFDDQAEALGVQTLLDSVEFEDPMRMLRHFYKLVCLAPDIASSRLYRLYPGYKQINRSDSDGDISDELFAVYSGFANGIGEDWGESRKLLEKDWGMVLGVEHPVKLVMKNNGNSVLVRFQVGPLHEPELVNQQIIDPTDWETQ